MWRKFCWRQMKIILKFQNSSWSFNKSSRPSFSMNFLPSAFSPLCEKRRKYWNSLKNGQIEFWLECKFQMNQMIHISCFFNECYTTKQNVALSKKNVMAHFLKGHYCCPPNRWLICVTASLARGCVNGNWKPDVLNGQTEHSRHSFSMCYMFYVL